MQDELSAGQKLGIGALGLIFLAIVWIIYWSGAPRK